MKDFHAWWVTLGLLVAVFAMGGAVGSCTHPATEAAQQRNAERIETTGCRGTYAQCRQIVALEAIAHELRRTNESAHDDPSTCPYVHLPTLDGNPQRRSVL